MGRKIDAEKRAEIVRAYLENDGATYKGIGARFGVTQCTISKIIKIIKEELQAGNGIKPDRRARVIKLPDGIEFEREALEAQHPRTSDWMEHIKPLNAHKRELELAVEHKQAELNKAQQELRDYLATIRQLMTEGNT